VWDEVVSQIPADQPKATLDDVIVAFGEFVDLKSVFSLGHSGAVARLAEESGRRAGLPEAECITLRRAGHLHDLGRVSVPTGVWEKRAPLSSSEWERVRLHPYYSERILERSAALAPLARLTGAHHERPDGSGYFRGARGTSLPLAARVLAAADHYQALIEPRPYRPARSPHEAAAALEASVPEELDAQAVRAVIEAAGHRPSTKPSLPNGLTERELKVLRHVTRGLSNKEIAQALNISPRTVQHHVIHAYRKIGVATRAAAAVYAMENGLL
jgi:HD-GYP domain-containing protein (c-di-GMP phosphodiesterase class II)